MAFATASLVRAASNSRNALLVFAHCSLLMPSTSSAAFQARLSTMAKSGVKSISRSSARLRSNPSYTWRGKLAHRLESLPL